MDACELAGNCNGACSHTGKGKIDNQLKQNRATTMQDLRIVLGIVGALAIAALVIHGVWTNQRNKRAQLKIHRRSLFRINVVLKAAM